LLALFFFIAASFDQARVDHIIESVNSKNVGWTAGKNQFFEGKTQEEIKSLFGWDKNSEKKKT